MRVDYKKYIDDIPNHPQEGILYRDIQPLLANDNIFQQAIIDLGTLTPEVPDYWVGIESRGFLFASALSIHFGGGIKLIRKWGKLPRVDLVNTSYQLEYGVDMIDMKEGKNANCGIVIGVLTGEGTRTELLNAGADMIVDKITDLYL